MLILDSNNTIPESSEVRIVAEQLGRELSGSIVLYIFWDAYSRYSREEISGYAEVRSKFPARIQLITVKGKHIIFVYQSIATVETFYMISFLGMEGKWTSQKGNHSNLWFLFGQPLETNTYLLEKVLYYDDSRHFGAISFYPNQAALTTKLNTFGPDVLAYALYLQGQLPTLPISEHITADIWRAKFRNPRLLNKEVGVFLLDQNRFSGVGNYQRCESLYIARVSPHRPLGQMTDAEIEALRLAVFDIVYRAYIARGATLRTYQTPYGEKGEFQCVVYGKAYCPLGHPVTRTPTKDKRTAHWVPAIQT